MKRTLSSAQTFFIKIILPIFFIISWGILTSTLIFNHFTSHDSGPFWWTAPLGLGVVIGFLVWAWGKIKKVSVDEKALYVSNYFHEIAIPLQDIRNVTQNNWLREKPVTIHLKSLSEFGDKITFIPKALFFSFARPHPVVDELKALAHVSENS